MTSSEGLRERKKRQTRDALQSAALRLMRDAGPEAVTVDRICREADVSRRTFFNYFASKDEAVFAWGPDVERQVVDAVVDAPATWSPLDAAIAAIRGVFQEAMRGDRWREQQAIMHAHPELLVAGLRLSSALEGLLAEGLACRTGDAASDVGPQTVAATAVAAATVVVRRWQTCSDVDIDAVFDEVFATLTDATDTGGRRH